MPATLPPEMTRYPSYRRLGGPQSRSGRVRKVSPLPGFAVPTELSPQNAVILNCLLPSVLFKKLGKLIVYFSLEVFTGNLSDLYEAVR